MTVIVDSIGAARNFSFEAGMGFIGPKPIAQAITKTGVFSFVCLGQDKQDVLATYAVQD